jgi:hypothetical protein
MLLRHVQQDQSVDVFSTSICQHRTPTRFVRLAFVRRRASSAQSVRPYVLRTHHVVESDVNNEEDIPERIISRSTEYVLN